MTHRITAAELNAFVTPAVEVLEKLASISTEVGTLSRQPSSIPVDILIILIGLEGDLEGTVVFQFDRPVLMKILTSLLGSLPASLTDPLCLDAMGEVANIIAGNATGRLEELGLRTTITPPIVLTGEEGNHWTANREGMIIPLNSAVGKIGICTFLQKS
jgi:chemotaxis protein CheX